LKAEIINNFQNKKSISLKDDDKIFFISILFFIFKIKTMNKVKTEKKSELISDKNIIINHINKDFLRIDFQREYLISYLEILETVFL
jgi:hypothetical protein